MWLALGAAVFLVAAFLVTHRRPGTATAVAAPAAPAVVPPATLDTADSHDAGKLTLPPEPERAPAAVEPRVAGEQPLPTWARAAIVVGALLAFLAVSLIAKKA